MSIVLRVLWCALCRAVQLNEPPSQPSIVVYIEFAWNYAHFNLNDYFMKTMHLLKPQSYVLSSKSHSSIGPMSIPVWTKAGIGDNAANPSRICLPRTELLQSPFRMEFGLGSRSWRYRQSLQRHRRFLQSYCRSLLRSLGNRRPLMRWRRSLRDSLNIIGHC